MTYTRTKVNFLCEPSTIFKATTIFIMISLHIVIMATSCLQTIQCNVSIEFVCWNKDLYICMYVHMLWQKRRKGSWIFRNYGL